MNEVNIPKSFTPGLSSGARQKMFENNYAEALALGDPRMELKKLDRPGISRGAGQQRVAQANATGQMVDALAKTYNEDRQMQTEAAINTLQGQEQDAAFGQQMGGFGANDYYSNAMNQISARQAGLNLATSLLGGLLS
jgi:hypothetical protein